MSAEPARRLGAARCAALTCVALVTGCFDNTASVFPAGLEPWEPNAAPPPSTTAGDVCPETITFARLPDWGHATSVHARACIHAPPGAVWRAIQNPQTLRDPTSSDPPFMVLSPIPDECDGAYETQVHVHDIIDVDFRLCFRHALIDGTDDAPLLTTTRWQKVWGTTVITSLEGSLVSRPHPDDATITELELQYHFDALIDDPERMESYLSSVFTRLRDDAHGVPLLPADF